MRFPQVAGRQGHVFSAIMRVSSRDAIRRGAHPSLFIGRL
jgi:hypothetical protein